MSANEGLSEVGCTPPGNGLQLAYPRGNLGVMEQLVRFLLLARQRVALRIPSHGIGLLCVAKFNVCAGKGFLLFSQRRH